MTNINDRSYAVDGAGRIIRPGNQVRIRRAKFSDPDEGRIVSLTEADTAMVDTGDGEPRDFFVNRLARFDGPDDEPVWVLGSL